jgi:multisubunit Na+/H+ antiporter MnhF subunit
VNLWLLGAVALLLGGMAPALSVASRGDPASRLVGLVLGGQIATLALLLLAQGFGQSSYLIVPLVLAVLSFPGVLVFTRLLRPRP